MRSILPGSAASQDGRLKTGDTLFGIESESGEVIDFKGMDIYKIGRLLRGLRDHVLLHDVRLEAGDRPA